MLITKKMLLVLTLVGALVGAGIGSLITHSASTSSAANNKTEIPNTSANSTDVSYKTPQQVAADNSAQFNTPEEQTAYREGFDAGYSTCTNPSTNSRQTLTSYRTTRRYSNGRRVYYDYSSAPRGRSFWQKHRDKLTMAIGTGLGAAIGGIAGGKKGAGIGALAGLGGSALYTYKLRHRTRRY